MPTTPVAVFCWPAGWVYGHIIATHHAGAAVPVGSKYQAAEDADGDLPWIFSYVARRYAWIFSVAMLVLFLFSCSSTNAKSVEPSWFQQKSRIFFSWGWQQKRIEAFHEVVLST